jgi:hypothetical protein
LGRGRKRKRKEREDRWAAREMGLEKRKREGRWDLGRERG